MKTLRLAALALAFAGAAQAQEAPSTVGRAIGGLFDALGARKTPPAAPDFVQESRPAQLDYVPLTVKAKGDPKRDAAQMRAVGAELDRAAAENKRKAARVKIPN